MIIKYPNSEIQCPNSDCQSYDIRMCGLLDNNNEVWKCNTCTRKWDVKFPQNKKILKKQRKQEIQFKEQYNGLYD